MRDINFGSNFIAPDFARSRDAAAARIQKSIDESPTMQVEVFEVQRPPVDLNEEALKTAKFVKRLRDGDPEAHLVVPVDFSQGLAKGDPVTVRLDAKSLAALTDESKAALADAGAVLKEKSPEDAKPSLKHEKIPFHFSDSAPIIGTPNHSPKAVREDQEPIGRLDQSRFESLWNISG